MRDASRAPSPGRIRFQAVSKRFRRGQVHDSLRDLLPALTRRLLGRADPAAAARDFWALRDVTFHVDPGESLGIIGHNGAGKSTILKILTRILRPTSGTVEVVGRVGALIEVVAGFHPDLTGRENVFLQGAIMGMPRRHIERHFDEIIAFAGVEGFVDTPVKRYSSGMSARLGFAIAAHLDPDALIIDEVLAVGDAAFQKRAFEKLRGLARSGIPVVVVSHQLDRIAEFCTRCLVLRQGEVVAEGSPQACIAEYVKGAAQQETRGAGACPVELTSIQVGTDEHVTSGGEVTFEIGGALLRPLEEPIEPLNFFVRSLQTGAVVYESSASRLGVRLPDVGPFAVSCTLQANVPEGSYAIESFVFDSVRDRFYAFGPSALFHVAPSESFRGSIQLNARMRALDGASVAP